MRRRCRIGMHLYDYEHPVCGPDATHAIYNECVYCRQVFYTGSDHGAANKTKEWARSARHRAHVRNQRLTVMPTSERIEQLERELDIER